MNTIDVQSGLNTLADKLKQCLIAKHIAEYRMVGIRSGGVYVAKKISDILQPNAPIGMLDISYYRDDFTHRGLHPDVKPSHIPFSINDQHIILIDDVIQTGRTIKAALDTLFEYGRPASVILVCLVELKGRELPIETDLIGVKVDPSQGKRVKLIKSEPLQLQVFTE